MEQKVVMLPAGLSGLCHICMRPGIYTRTGSFGELVAFIEGYDLGRGASIGMKSATREMALFGEWLSRQCGITECKPWEEILLLYCEGDERRAVEQLGPLFSEFIAAELLESQQA